MGSDWAIIVALQKRRGLRMPAGRPVTRLYRVDRDLLEMLHEVFGKSTMAYRRLRLEGLVGLDTFRLAWEGREVTRPIVQAVERGWDSFADRIVERQLKRLGAVQ